MRTYTAIIERCPVTRQYVGHVPALPGAHTHADTLDELHDNLVEVVTLVLKDEDPSPRPSSSAPTPSAFDGHAAIPILGPRGVILFTAAQ